MDEAVSFRLSTLQSTKDSVIRNRSTDRISPHSIKSKSQNLILSKIIHDNLPLIMNDIATNKHLKSLSICTNTLTISKLSYKHLLLVSAIITHQRWMYWIKKWAERCNGSPQSLIRRYMICWNPLKSCHCLMERKSSWLKLYGKDL
jgi:hypothetical protein